MIPAFSPSGVLPPFLGGNPTLPAHASPYDVSASELVVHFATTLERVDILGGLFTCRAQLYSVGIVSGFQWLDGSFVEDIEAIEGRPPRDIDVVTFAHRPANVRDPTSWNMFFQTNLSIFDPRALKSLTRCDAYYVDLDAPPTLTVASAGYWHGLFAHRRSGAWKGMLRLPLSSDDIVAQSQLVVAHGKLVGSP